MNILRSSVTLSASAQIHGLFAMPAQLKGPKKKGQKKDERRYINTERNCKEIVQCCYKEPLHNVNPAEWAVAFRMALHVKRLYLAGWHSM